MTDKFIKITKNHQTEFTFFLKKIFPVVMKWEGGGKLHNVSGDTGGNTIWGIAYNKNKQHFDSLADHANTTEEEAAAFAFVEYYLKLSPENLKSNIKLLAFDIAYNMGVSRAIEYIQECSGVKADGIIGPNTKNNMNKASVARVKKETYVRDRFRLSIDVLLFNASLRNRKKTRGNCVLHRNPRLS